MDFTTLTPAGFLTTCGSALFVVSVAFVLWLLFVAFRTNIGWGFGCLIAPFLMPVFAIRYWRNFGNPLLFLAGVGTVLMLLSMHYVAPKHVPWHSGLSESELVKRNVQIVRVAADAYAADHDGVYPNQMDAVFKSYFPDGDCGKGRKLGTPLTNPYSEKLEWPALGRRVAGTERRARAKESGRSLISDAVARGAIVYSPLYDKRNRCSGFAVAIAIGDDRSGRELFQTEYMFVGSGF